MPRKRKDQQPDNALQSVQPDQPVKARGRGGKYNFPTAVPPENPDEVKQALTECMHWYMAGNCPAKTDDEIEQRTIEFFQYCIEHGERPTVEKYCLALGYVRTTVNEWERGNNASSRRMDIIKRAKEFLASYDANMATIGKLNPVLYIFRGKNYYAMSDKQEYVLTPNNPLSDISVDEVGKKYKELPTD